MKSSGHSNSEAGQAIAIIQGKAITELPQDLYIPPDALRVFLEAFEGPLDLLLYLIKKQNIDILNIPIAEVTRQYIHYVEVMQELNLELAAEYLVMASFLAEIKSRLLLPKPATEQGQEADPRAQLIIKLQEYERFKKAAENLNGLPQVDRDIFLPKVQPPEINLVKPHPKVELQDLFLALASVLQRMKHNTHHQIQLEPLSIRERMTDILNKISTDKFMEFSDFFSIKEGRVGVVITFIALLELIRQSLIEMVQVQPYAPIHIRAIK
jgi:segregation and condensation protein A